MMTTRFEKCASGKVLDVPRLLCASKLYFFLREMKLDFQNGGRSDHVAHFHMNITFDDNLSAPVIFVQLFSRCANQYPSSFKIAV